MLIIGITITLAYSQLDAAKIKQISIRSSIIFLKVFNRVMNNGFRGKKKKDEARQPRLSRIS